MCTTCTTAFDIRVIELIAGWYISAKCDLFTNVDTDSGARFGLDSSRMELEVRMDLSSNFKDAEDWPCGDVVSAVYWYLRWYSENETLPPDEKPLLNCWCFKQMFLQAQPDDLSWDAARALVGNKRWRPLLMIALAFAYQCNIVHRFGFHNADVQYKTMSVEANT